MATPSRRKNTQKVEPNPFTKFSFNSLVFTPSEKTSPKQYETLNAPGTESHKTAKVRGLDAKGNPDTTKLIVERPKTMPDPANATNTLLTDVAIPPQESALTAPLQIPEPREDLGPLLASAAAVPVIAPPSLAAVPQVSSEPVAVLKSSEAPINGGNAENRMSFMLTDGTQLTDDVDNLHIKIQFKNHGTWSESLYREEGHDVYEIKLTHVETLPEQRRTVQVLIKTLDDETQTILATERKEDLPEDGRPPIEQLYTGNDLTDAIFDKIKDSLSEPYSILFGSTRFPLDAMHILKKVIFKNRWEYTQQGEPAEFAPRGQVGELSGHYEAAGATDLESLRITLLDQGNDRGLYIETERNSLGTVTKKEIRGFIEHIPFMKSSKDILEGNLVELFKGRKIPLQ